jgi:hypothetical protein
LVNNFTPRCLRFAIASKSRLPAMPDLYHFLFLLSGYIEKINNGLD